MGLGIFIGWQILSPGTPPDAYYTPATYTPKVNALIKKRLLTATCPPDNPPQIDDSLLCSDNCPENTTESASGTNSTASNTNPPPVATEDEKEWYKSSYLKEDVRRFNEEPAYSWTFVISNVGCELVGIHERAHRISMPFATKDPWKGDIYYNGQASGVVLKSIKRELTLYQPAKAGKKSARLRSTRLGQKDSIGSERIELRSRRGSVAAIRHTTERLGGQLVVKNLLRSHADGAIGLMGYKIPLGRHAWLSTGDWLQVRGTNSKDKEVFVYVDTTSLPVASAMHRRNGDDVRSNQDDQLGWFYDPDTDEPIPFVNGLAQRIGVVLNEDLEGPKIDRDFHVQLTINPQLQRALSTKFHKICDGYRYRINGGNPFKAGLTVMNGKTGDILATATYPWPEDIPYGTRDRARMLLNQNFIRHPIGSIIKPIIFSAITHTHPYLASLKLRGYGSNKKHEDILYCKVKPGYQIHGMGFAGKKSKRRSGGVDFVMALAKSSNKYTVELATLALAAGDNAIKGSDNINWRGRSSISINGGGLKVTPDFSSYMELPNKTKTPIECRQLKDMENLAYLKALERITGVPTYAGRAPTNVRQDKPNAIYDAYLAQRYDTVPLQPLLNHFIGNSQNTWEVKALLTGIAPEQVNLGFNYLRNFRQDYVSLVLGSGNSSWTNIQLAAAMSNLITDTIVKPRLIATLLDKDKQAIPANMPPIKRLNLNSKVRDKLLRGLAGVVSSGTAGRLRRPLRTLQRHLEPTGYRVFVFSKTGTPSVERRIPRAMGKILITLHRSYLFYQNGKLHIKVPKTVKDPNEVETATYRTRKFVRLLRKALIQIGYRRNYSQFQRSLMAIFYEFDQDNKTQSSGIGESGPSSGPLEVTADGRLGLNLDASIFRSRRRKSKAGAYAFTLVKIPRRLLGRDSFPTPAKIRDPRTQVLTGIIYLDIPVMSSVAVHAAGQLLGTIGGFNVSAPTTAAP
ncbi:hypothetical protein TI05_10470 [Achromatium sp. WMS3]|nr:hypothetical protein TI05_10470 [Achromatium sp. WMS3]